MKHFLYFVALSYDPAPMNIVKDILVVAFILAVVGVINWLSSIPPRGKEILWTIGDIAILFYLATAIHLFG